MFIAISVMCFAILCAYYLYRTVKARRREEMDELDDSFATHTPPGDKGRRATEEEIKEFSGKHHVWTDYWFQDPNHEE